MTTRAASAGRNHEINAAPTGVGTDSSAIGHLDRGPRYLIEGSGELRIAQHRLRAGQGLGRVESTAARTWLSNWMETRSKGSILRSARLSTTAPSLAAISVAASC